MEIIWGKNEKGKELDLILDVTLRAVIVRDGSKAYVVEAKNQNSAKDILSSYATVDDVKYVDIIFNPDRALNNLDYILASDEEKKEYEELVVAFQIAFYDEVVKLADKSDELLRAHQLILTWKKFNQRGTFIGISDEEAKFVENDLAEYRERSNREMRQLLTNLIIKYTVYIAVWEKSYYKNDIFRIIHGKFSNYEIKTHEKTETELEDTDFESDSCVRNYDKIVEDFDEGTEVEKSDAKRMYDEIHQKLSVLPGMDSSKADFFYVNKHSLKYKHKTLCQIMKITKRIMAREKKRRDGKEYKKYIFEHAVKEEPYAQISFKLCDLLQLGVEIVAFNVIRFNGKLLYKEDKLSYEKVTSGSAEKWFIDYADDMQLKIIPYLHFILCCSAKEKDEKDKKDKKDKDYFSPYIVMYKEAVGMFDNIDGFRLLDKSNWGNNENETRKEIEKKARKYWRVRRLSIRKKAKTTENYTAVNIRSKMQYSDKRQRYIFPDIHLQQMAIKYEFFIKETKGAMTANISTELQRQL